MNFFHSNLWACKTLKSVLDVNDVNYGGVQQKIKDLTHNEEGLCAFNYISFNSIAVPGGKDQEFK